MAVQRLGLHTLAVNPGRIPGRELRSHQPHGAVKKRERNLSDPKENVCRNVARRSRTQERTLATPLTVSDTLREGRETAEASDCLQVL